MKKWIAQFVLLLCCMLALAVASCSLANTFFDGSFDQKLSMECLQSNLAVMDGHLIKVREYQNNIAIASIVEDGLTLEGNYHQHALYQPNYWAVVNNYLLAFYYEDNNNVIKIFDSSSSTFLEDFSPIVTFTVVSQKMVVATEVNGVFYLAFYVPINSEYSIERTIGEQTDTLAITQKLFKKNRDSGFLVLTIDTNNTTPNAMAIFFGGANPKQIHIDDSGIYTLFRTSYDNTYFVKYSLVDFSKKAERKIKMYYLLQYFVDGEYTIILSKIEEFDKNYNPKRFEYSIKVFDKELKELDSVTSAYDYGITAKLYHSQYYISTYGSLAQGYDVAEFEYTFDGSKLSKRPITTTSIYGNTTIVSSLNHSQYGDTSNYSILIDSSYKTISFCKTATKEIISSATLPFSLTSMSTLTQAYFDAKSGYLYFCLSTKKSGLESYNGLCRMNTKSVDTTLEFIGYKLTVDMLDENLGAVSFEFYRMTEDRIFLVYDSLIVELGMDMQSLAFVDLRKTVTIFFLNDDGSEAAPSQKREVGSKITSDEIRSVVPIREGYTFVRWVKQEDDRLYNLVGDIILTAVWEEDDND